MSQNLQNFIKFQTFQLDNLVDFEKCGRTHIYFQKSLPIQPKTSNIFPKFCQTLATTLRVRRACAAGLRGRRVLQQLGVRPGEYSVPLFCWRAAAGRAWLLAKKRHAGHLLHPGVTIGFLLVAPLSTGWPCISTLLKYNRANECMVAQNRSRSSRERAL